MRLKTSKDLGLKDDDTILFIAEAGINHNGSVENAKRLIDMAIRCNADAVKFQKRKINRILTKEGLEMPYNNERSFGGTYGEHKEHLELTEDEFRELKAYSDKNGIMFVASGWDEESVDFLDELGVNFFKMASADLTNFPLLEHTARKGKPMIISTGMADIYTVQAAYELISKINDKIAILQCTSTYPTNDSEIDLEVIHTYQKLFTDAVIGYSGHERGLQITIAAAAYGAKIIERHFTLDRTMRGGDHAASLEEHGLYTLVRDIHIVEKARGSSLKRLHNSEKPCFKKLSKSVVSEVAIPAGTVITRDMLTTKGPGTGISPMRLNDLVGMKTSVDIAEDVVMKACMIEDFN